jgi:hypothetical protein
MQGKSRMFIDVSLQYAKTYPDKKVVIMTLSQESAKQVRKQLVEANGGARPFNIKVRVF